MHEYIRILKKTIFIILIISILQNCKSDNNLAINSFYKKGIYDLTSIDLSGQNFIELKSGWNFYPNVLLFTNQELVDFPKMEEELDEGCIFYSNLLWKSTVTECNRHNITKEGHNILDKKYYGKIVDSFHSWKTEKIENSNEDNAFGTAIYGISLRLNPGEYGLFEENWALSSAGRIWIYDNNKIELLMNIGYPGTNKQTTRPMWSGVSRNFRIEDGNVMIIIEVANFHHRSGYLGYSLNLSNKRFTLDRTIHYFQLELAIFGLILMVGLYNFILFILKPDQKATFWFSLLCVFLAVRVLLIARIPQNLYPEENSFTLLLKLEYLTFSMPPLFLALYLCNLFSYKVSLKLLYFIEFYCLAVSLVVLLTPTDFFSNYLIFVIFCVIFVMLFGMIELIRKWNSQSKDIRFLSRSIFIVFFLFAITVMHDILMSFGYFQSYDLSGIGLGFFTFGQGIVIAYNNSNAWKISENLASELLEINSELDKKVRERTFILENAWRSMQKDLNFAQKIQRSILPLQKIDDIRLQVHNYFLPLNEVGGDFYDFDKLDNDTYRFFVADATGHGVQAGLITMLVKSEYENLKFYSDSPAYILTELNKRYISKYKNIGMYFSCVICDIFLETREIRFAAAGHPDQLLFKNGTIHKLTSSGGLIGLSNNSHYSLIKEKIETGDSMLLFTDGLFEQFNSEGEIFGEERLETEYIRLKTQKLGYTHLENSINDWIKGKSLKDDICLLGIEIM